MTLTDRFVTLLTTPAGRAEARRWLDGRELVRKLSSSRGRARGGGQSSKAKGRHAVQQVRDLLRDQLGIPEDDMLIKATSMPGEDLYLAPAAKARFPWGIEVKCVEALNIWAALAQATVNAEGCPPIVFFKRAQTPMYVAVRVEDFLALQKQVNSWLIPSPTPAKPTSSASSTPSDANLPTPSPTSTTVPPTTAF